MSSKLLSICIPTYNRAELLNYNLSLLCPLLDQFSDIAIVVSDNCSTDDTIKILENYRSRYSSFSYFVQEQNFGADKNFETVLKLTDSKYQWLLGDSKTVDEKGVRKIIELLSNYAPQLLLLNSGLWNEVPSKTYKNKNIFLEEQGWQVTNIACLIFSKDLITNANFNRYYSTHLLQFGIVFEYLACFEQINVLYENNQILINFEEQLISKFKTNSWYPSLAWHIFAESWTNTVLSLPTNYSLPAKKKCILNHNRYTKIFSVRSILLMRNLNVYNFATFKKYRLFINYAIGNKKVLYFILSLFPNILNPYQYKKILQRLR